MRHPSSVELSQPIEVFLNIYNEEKKILIIIILKSLLKIWVDYIEISISILSFPCFIIFLSNFPLSFLYPF
jgi:hypothetical protein